MKHSEPASMDEVIALQDSGKWEESLSLCLYLANRNPESVELHLRLAAAFYEVGEFDKAVAEYRQVLQLAPEHWEAQRLMGSVLMEQGEVQAAVAAWSEIIEGHPPESECALAHRCLADAYVAMGDRTAAERELRRAIQISPEMPEPYHHLGVLLEDQKCRKKAQEYYGRALALYNEAVTANPGDPELHHNLGLLLGCLGQREEAIAELQEAARLRPTADILFALGANLTTQARKARGEKAKALWRAARQANRETLELHPRYQKACHNLGLAEWKLGNPTAAIEHLEKACELALEEDSYALLSRVYFSVGRWRDSRRTLAEFVNLKNRGS